MGFYIKVYSRLEQWYHWNTDPDNDQRNMCSSNQLSTCLGGAVSPAESDQNSETTDKL